MARGSIQDRGDRWEIVVSLGTDPVTGRRRRRSRTVDKDTHSRRDAEKVLTELLSESDQAVITPTAGTIGQVVEAWLDLVDGELSPTTLRRYRQIVVDYVIPRWGDVRLVDLRVVDLDQWYLSLTRGGPGRRALAASSVRQVHAVLRKALSQAVKWGYLPGNPVRDASLPRLSDDEIDPPSMAEVRSVVAKIAEAGDERMRAIVVLLAATGLRRSEVCGLRWRDLDLEAGELRVRRVIVQVGREVFEKAPKTRSSKRPVSIDPTVVEYLVAYRDLVREHARVSGVTLGGAAWMFSRALDGSTSMIPDSVTQSWRRYARSAQVSARLHDLRHAHATELIAAGVDIRTVASRLGHSQTSTTLNIYSHAMKARDQEAAAIIGPMLLA